VFPSLHTYGLPTGTGGGFANIDGSPTVYCTPTNLEGTSVDRRDVTKEFTTTGAQTYTFTMYCYPMFVHRVKATVAGVQIKNIPAVVVDREIIAIANNLRGPTEALVLLHGGRLSLCGNITLTSYDSVQLHWSRNTNVWRPIAIYKP